MTDRYRSENNHNRATHLNRGPNPIMDRGGNNHGNVYNIIIVMYAPLTACVRDSPVMTSVKSLRPPSTLNPPRLFPMCYKPVSIFRNLVNFGDTGFFMHTLVTI